MSLRIKIPASKPPPPTDEADMQENLPGRRKRKLPKRYQQSDDDEDFLDAIEPAPKQRRSSLSHKSRRRVSDFNSPSPIHTAEGHEFAEDNASPEPTVDVEMEEGDYQESQQTVASTSSAGVGGRPPKAKDRHEASISRKRAKVVLSDSEEDENAKESQEASVAGGGDDDDDDVYLSTEEKKPRVLKGKGKAAGGAGKPAKRKAKLTETDGFAYDEGKKGTATEGLARKKLKASGKSEDSTIDVVGESSATLEEPPSAPATSTSPATSKPESPAPAPKKKLPTIKKNRIPPGTNTGTSTPTSKKPAIELPGTGRPTHEEIRKTIINKTDIDLSDKSIYQAIFSKTVQSDSSIRSGPNREERRKDLNKMREEARARREQEAVHSFDLQAQYEKISRFEETLRSTRSIALFPNFLGAKWKDVYEKEKAKQKEAAWQGSQDSQMSNGREEGEVG
ncbi:hypothetical protein BJ165DRAFT_1400075 [Panaeolus papilionaceus]|nr:hypothetical protein BJ165DRAFT_1400075 [Panaeolus papilionaceus]